MARAEAPTEGDFVQVLRAVRERRSSCASGMPGVAGRKKMRRMEFCSGEAAREIERAFLRGNGLTMTLLQDARKNRLLIRFRAAKTSKKKIETR